MRNVFIALVAAVALLATGEYIDYRMHWGGFRPAEAADSPSVIVRFANSVPDAVTQGKEIQTAAVANVESAKHSVHLLAYSLTDKALCEALARAQWRGVEVQVVMDAHLDASKPALRFLQVAHVPVRLLKVSGLMHEKTLITDGWRAMAGSYNWTDGARDRNCENSIEWEDSTIAAQFDGNFKLLWDAAAPPPEYKPPLN